jgi:hypothetical protein
MNVQVDRFAGRTGRLRRVDRLDEARIVIPDIGRRAGHRLEFCHSMAAGRGCGHRTYGWPGGQRLAAAVGRAGRQSRGSAAPKSEGDADEMAPPASAVPQLAGSSAGTGRGAAVFLTPRAQDFSLDSQSCVRYERARYGARRGGCCLMTFPPLACTRGSLPLGVAAEIACARRICDGSSS